MNLFVYPDRDLRFTYAQFDERVNCLAKGLLYMGFAKATKLGIWPTMSRLADLHVCHRQDRGSPGYDQYKLQTSELEYLMQNADIHTLCLVDGFRDSDYVQHGFRIGP
jgi:fatty-acyl-CoA synthase